MLVKCCHHPLRYDSVLFFQKWKKGERERRNKKSACTNFELPSQILYGVTIFLSSPLLGYCTFKHLFTFITKERNQNSAEYIEFQTMIF